MLNMSTASNLTLEREAEPDVGSAVAFDHPPATSKSEAFLQELRILSERSRARRYVRLIAMFGDLAAITLAVVAMGELRFGEPFTRHVQNLLGFALPVYAAVALNRRCYNLDAIVSGAIGTRRVAYAFAVTLGLVGLAAFFFSASEGLSRAVFGLSAVVGLVLLMVFRSALAAVAAKIPRLNLTNEVVIRDGVDISAAPNRLIIDTSEHDFSLQLDDPNVMDRLGRYLRLADRVVVACPSERRKAWSTALKGADVDGEVIAPELDEVGALGIRRFGSSSTLLVAKSPLRGTDRALKRALDLVLSITFIVVLAPIMLAVAVAVRVDSPGPILFRQKRLGLGNRMFEMYKFRSMYAEKGDATGSRSTGRSDDRVTRVGRFIRATSLDELPQLFNVLLGDMSIVGPRPHPILCKAEDRLFWDIDRAYWRRHAVKPGITGLAQVRGLRGTTEKTIQFTDRLQADLEYLEGWSIWRDIAIILATIRVVTHRNAY
jgi:exopolysaccharide biosynthesis polyprenyl glycosylphosphotransferase